MFWRKNQNVFHQLWQQFLRSPYDPRGHNYSLNQHYRHWKMHYVLILIFYSQKFPVIRQNTAWKKSSHSTVLRNPSGGLKFFLVVVEAPNSHHVSCTYSNWRKWVQFGPTHSMAIFGRCEKFTSVIAIFVKTFLCTLRHPKTTWYHSKA